MKRFAPQVIGKVLKVHFQKSLRNLHKCSLVCEVNGTLSVCAFFS